MEWDEKAVGWKFPGTQLQGRPLDGVHRTFFTRILIDPIRFMQINLIT